MAISNIKAVFQMDLETLWDVVVSLEDYAWRSDLDRIEVLRPGKEFVEYAKGGYSTRFTITAFEPYKRYEFDMDNENMKGHWTGSFSGREGEAAIDFTEDVTAKKFFMKPFVKQYLKRQQAAYIADLKKKLEGRGA